VRLYHTQRIDDAVIAATRVLGLLYESNEAALAGGWRRGEEATLLDYHSFYNDAVNQEVSTRPRKWLGLKVPCSY